MAKTTSSMLPLGTLAPQFSLVDVLSEKTITLRNEPHDIATVIMFICNHCPYVKHVSHELSRLAHDYIKQRIRFLAINSNDVIHYPDDSPENMRKEALKNNYSFPYLFDETQEVARAYQATCTPDFFVFNKKNQLVYRGQLDDSRPGNQVKVDGNSVRTALNCLLNDQPIPSLQKPSIGCNIKWKENKPVYEGYA
jgi:thiol-disulfide isomerase/thioredoxin